METSTGAPADPSQSQTGGAMPEQPVDELRRDLEEFNERQLPDKIPTLVTHTKAASPPKSVGGLFGKVKPSLKSMTSSYILAKEGGKAQNSFADMISQKLEKSRKSAPGKQSLSMGVMAALAAKEDKEKEKVQEDHSDAELQFIEYDTKSLVSNMIPSKDAANFIIDLHGKCTAEHQERIGDAKWDQTATHSGDGSAVCRWVHMRGVNFKLIDALGTAFQLMPEVVAQCKEVASGAEVTWHNKPRSTAVSADGTHRTWTVKDMRYDHLFIVAHYLQKAAADRVGIESFEKEQMAFILIPDFNLLISVDADGRKNMEAVESLLYNMRAPVRKQHHAVLLLLAIVDSMVDEVRELPTPFCLNHSAQRWPPEPS
jgi:hypothetical protein